MQLITDLISCRLLFYKASGDGKEAFPDTARLFVNLSLLVVTQQHNFIYTSSEASM